MIVIEKLDWSNINKQLQVLYRLKTLKNIINFKFRLFAEINYFKIENW